MAWLDDRAWCHPKLVELSAPAFRVYVNGICYASGFATEGVLTGVQQKLIGTTDRIRTELAQAGLWDGHADGVIIHDWDAHNGLRDEKRRQARERKRDQRDRERDQSTILRDMSREDSVTSA